MWIVKVALLRPYTFIMLAALLTQGDGPGTGPTAVTARPRVAPARAGTD
jgi:hypothetical protein